MKNITQVIRVLLPQGPMDNIAVGIIDFKEMSFDSIEAAFLNGEVTFESDQSRFFDLASLTKPLCNSLSYFLKPELFDEKMLLCLNHRGGLPAWGLLSKITWKDQILSYPISSSETLYSDFSALRVMLELEKKSISQKELCGAIWDLETVFWKDLPADSVLPQTGFYRQRPNYGMVHDPNASTIGEFCSHAGLFATINGLCQTLLKYEEKTGFIEKVKKDSSSHQHRFSLGWDRVAIPQDTLAGKGCGPFSFGHLGFTGTSIWIDPDARKGHVILTNAVKEHWFDKSNLNDLRRAIGELVWKNEL